MESRFGHDFTQVRVHTGREADASADAVQAEAFTVGQHIVFRDGRYAPSTEPGRSLLAHELAHTVQQGDAPVDRPLRVSTPGDAGEREAHGLAASAAAGEGAPPVAAGPAQVSRADREFLLTFDDGPHAAPLGGGKNRTENVLDSLCRKQARSAFFVQTAAEDDKGNKMRGSSPNGRKLIKRMHDDGHTVGVHTGGKKDHEIHPEAEKAGRLKTELSDAKDFVKDVTGAAPGHVRPPQGKVDAAVEKTYASVASPTCCGTSTATRGPTSPPRPSSSGSGTASRT
jgi:peptidoglycan/xylan/chitin deacetylase (PgdA/CDA1 family)